jgi:anthranilate phosphoribosyltransferase
LPAGVKKAQAILHSGEALTKLEQLAAFTQSLFVQPPSIEAKN